LQSGEGIPKSLWWKIEATFLIGFFFLGGWGRGRLLFCNIFEGDLGELVFQHNFYLFYEIRKLKEEKEGEKNIRSLN
jgi:hypothetical protein